ncbi:hypothetical protein D0869_14401 [Hortaea werneckii]|uniref:BTB domain-containing protein n=1 Tax=Hortaea werneckii TaxID=91943 RepID=A0A3M7AXB4_HORWE|nr:hypothetical protein KC334_g15629 [Hortaea werneckii]KAI6898359.1 hypothetical protein KC355_g20002 [Hortaea werneckii]KAI7175394.1 hypothetical protein KC324_g10089 [Hortaea werneckii]KAI7578807.1 hypothetical protein KC316_g9711 [Hortaea werneckii]KAI7651724.1 hypothetical protein KC318_g15487 [Hortaea werneckii]
MSQDDVPSLQDGLYNCFETGEYADMTITCGSRIWRVHKVVVCRVPFFAKAVTGKFKEARDSRIDLVDDDPSVVELVLRWLYNDTFHNEDYEQRDICEMLFLARSYKFGDKYLLAQVRTYAGQRLRAILYDCKWDAKDLLALVEELFASADESSKAAPKLLRMWVIGATYLNYVVCFHSSPSHIRFREVAFSRPDFLMGVMDIFQAKRSDTWKGPLLPDA